MWRETLTLQRPLCGAAIVGDTHREAAEAEAALRERYEQGRRNGQAELRQQLLDQRNGLLELQRGVLQSMAQALPQVIKQCEDSVAELALVVAQKIVAGIPISAELVDAVIREALSNLQDTHDITVLLNPDDLQLIQKYLAPESTTGKDETSAEPVTECPITQSFAGVEKVSFQPSAEVSRGGCLVRTRFGVLDATRESKYERLRASLGG